MAKVVVTEQIDPVGVALLKAAGHEVAELDMKGGAAVDPVRVGDADALLVRIAEVGGNVLEACPRLRIISKHGVGVDNIDVEAAKARGVAVTVAPGANSTSVAEHAFALLMALAKNLPTVCGRYREIGFAAKNCAPGVEISGKTLGVIGCGRIGSRIARMAHGGFGMRVLAYDKFPAKDSGIDYVDLPTLLAESDIISLHCPLTEETRHLIGHEAIETMKKGVVILNTSRGALIDAEALLEGIKARKVGAACLDVYEEEADVFFQDLSGHILNDDLLARLISMPNVIVTSHQAFLTEEALENIAETTVRNLLSYFENDGLCENELCYHCGHIETCKKAREERCF